MENKAQNTLLERITLKLGENKYVLRLIAIFFFLPICPFLNGIGLLIMLNGYFCVNFFQLILPNYILLQQAHEMQIVEHINHTFEINKGTPRAEN